MFFAGDYELLRRHRSAHRCHEAITKFDRVKTGPARKLEGATLNLNRKVFPRFCVGQETS